MSTTAEGIIVLFIVVFVFLLGRELMCWYFKLSRIVELLEHIKHNTQHKGGSNV